MFNLHRKVRNRSNDGYSENMRSQVPSTLHFAMGIDVSIFFIFSETFASFQISEKLIVNNFLAIFHRNLHSQLNNPTCPNCRVLMLFERTCHMCNGEFRTPYSIKTKCEICCSFDNLLDAIQEYYNIMN